MTWRGRDGAAGDGPRGGEEAQLRRAGRSRLAGTLAALLLACTCLPGRPVDAEPLPAGDAALVYQIRSSRTDDPTLAPESQTEQDVGLFLSQEIPNYGFIRAETHWLDAVGEAGEVGWTQVALTGLKLPAFAASLALADADIDARLLLRRLLILTDPVFQLEGARLVLAGATTEVALFGGRAIDRVGSLSTAVNRLDQDILGLTVRGAAGPVFLSALYAHAEGNGIGVGGRVPARTDTLGLGVDAPVAGPLALLGEVRYTTAPNVEGIAGRSSGLSYAVGPLLEQRGLRFEATAFSLDPAYVPIEGSDQNADRRGLYAGFNWDPWEVFGLFGSALRSRNNLAGDPSLATIETTQLMLGAHAFLALRWPIGLLLRGESTTLESRAATPSPVESRTTSLHGEASQTIGAWRPLVRARWSRLEDEVVDQTSDTIDLTGELWWQMTRRARIWGALEWSDLSATAGIADQTTATARVGGEQRVSANLFVRAEAEVVRTEQQGTRTTRTGAIGSVGYRHQYFDAYLDLRRSWTEVDLVDGATGEVRESRTDDGLYLRVTVPLRWGQPTPPPLGRHATTDAGGWGAVEGRVFLDEDGDGMPGPLEPGVGGLSVILDGLPGTVIQTDEEGRFAYARVAAGTHSVRLIVRKLPAEYDLVSPQLVELVIERRGRAQVTFAIQRLGRISGRVTRIRVASDGAEQPLADPRPISVYLKRGDDIWQTYTDDEGRYSFDTVRGGEYEILVDAAAVPEDAEAAPRSRTVGLGAGGVVEGIDFTIRQPARREIRNGGGGRESRVAPASPTAAGAAQPREPARLRPALSR